MSHLRAELISHRRRVCSLYKRVQRNNEAWCHRRDLFRRMFVHTRRRFDLHRDELDMRKAKELLRLGEEELFTTLHHQPLKFPDSPGGVAYERVAVQNDWVLDFWHPYEKEAFPDYFARREQRKAEFLEFWNKNYGGPNSEEEAKIWKTDIPTVT